MAPGPRSWRRGTALLARPMVPFSSGASQPAISTTSRGPTPATASRSRRSIAAASTSAFLPHQPRLVALPVALGGDLALVVGLLAGGDGDLELRQALVGPVEARGDQGAPFPLHRPDQLVDLLALEQEFPRAAGLVVEVRAGLLVGRDVGVDQDDLIAFDGGVALGDVGLAVAQAL